MKPAETKIMIVDDSPGHISLLGSVLEADYDILVASDGPQALLQVREELPDLILLDVIMPKMDGYEVCRRLKADEETRNIPVVFTTANTDTEEIIKGLQAGASYYLTKPIDIKMLKAVVKSVLTDQDAFRSIQKDIHQSHGTLVHLLDEGHFSFQTLDEAYDLAVLLANICPDPEQSVLGLRELLINAVEHGNLGITYSEKTQLYEDDLWCEEVAKRLKHPENRKKRVRVHFEGRGDELRFLISDEGKGFDWEPYLELDPARVFDTHGRGIAIARKESFDSVHYLKAGNEVLAIINRPPKG
ncbi:MAG: response regulator [Magnetococcales bacterium]|nr:response regulator [Magnetococcales bacterium]